MQYLARIIASAAQSWRINIVMSRRAAHIVAAGNGIG